MPSVQSRPRPSLREQAARGVAWSTLQTLGSRLLSVATFILLARLLRPHDFGVVAFASVAIALLMILVQQGFGAAIVQREHLEQRHLDTAFWISMGFGTALTLILFGASWPIAAAFNIPEAGPVLRVLSVTFILAGIASVQSSILQRRMAFRSLAFRQLLGNSVGAVVGISLAVLGAGVWALVAQTLSGALVGVIVLWNATRWRPGFVVTRATYRELFRFSRNVVGINTMGFFNRRTDDFFIGAFLGPVLLGIYSVAYRLLVVMTEVSIGTVQTVALPTFSRLQNDLPRLRRAYLSATRASAVVAMPAFIFMAAAAPEVIRVFFGPHWDRSVPVMRVLALMGVANTLTNFNSTVLTSLGRPHIVLRFMSVAAVTNVIAVAIAVHWGIIAVAIALTTRNWLVASPLSIYFVRRALRFSLRDYFSSYVAPMLSSCVVAGLVVLVHVSLGSSLGYAERLGLMLGGGGIVYLGTLALLDRGMLREVVGHGRAAYASRRGPVAAAQ